MSAAAPFDVCVLGAGPAGFAAAMRAHDLGKRVALVERRRVGGAGIHDGALSSKTLWHLSNDYFGARRTDRGYAAEGLKLSACSIRDVVRDAVRERRLQLERQLDALGAPDERGAFVEFVQGDAAFESPQEVVVRAGDGAERRIRASNFVVATGSRPRVPDGIVVDGHHVLTSDHIDHLEAFPESLVIVGAGVIGCEYATIFGNFGMTRINLIDRASRILPFEDADVASVIAASFERLGILIHRQSRLKALRVVGGKVEYTLTNAAGVDEIFRVERALVSVGRVPNVESLRLDRAGVEIDAVGKLVGDGVSTSQPHIFAAGDVSMDVALVNVAELEGRHAVERMFGLNPPPIRYSALSSIMFLRPEVASVGLNEQRAKELGIPYRVAVVSNALIARNIAMRATHGFVKLLAEPAPGDRILGLRVVGPQASSAVQGVAYLIDRGVALDAIDHGVHPHPAITEGVQECARILLGRSILKPAAFGAELLRSEAN